MRATHPAKLKRVREWVLAEKLGQQTVAKQPLKQQKLHIYSPFTRVVVDGKFLRRGHERFYVRGVTYGPFAPDVYGCEYGCPERVERDFADMVKYGVNCVRVYTPPPIWLLDIAAQHGLNVMVGLPWEQHVAFLDEPDRASEIVERVRTAAASCANHPAVFCFAVGNEIPASIVRWHGKRAIERFLRRLYEAVKEEAPDRLVTYVNYPSTEYLDLGFCDFFCFNVYLEDRTRLEAYFARLQNIAEDRPLILAELGLDTQRNGEKKQAEVLAWQIESVFNAGMSGLFLFAWTDEWHRGGHDIEDWSFGLTTRSRDPKPALSVVRRCFEDVPFRRDVQWPKISVLVCTYNGSKTLEECLRGIGKLKYPDYETIVVSDGSTDRTHQIAQKFEGVRLIVLERNGGLSNARNVAARAAQGEIVAYIDDDAYPDPYWLHYLAHSFRTTGHAGIGGPNIPPPGACWIADCVANSPGGPTHVLLSDTTAEHIPGCNMAFRRDALLNVGGFDPTFVIAGDDVDLCWRLQAAGFTLGFSPAALVWHHRRNSARAYLRQQRNYGRAEAMLERKWPEKYNSLGHVPWNGRIYGRGVHRHFLPGRTRIYQGVWGLAPFQRVYEPATDFLGMLVRMPEWYLLTLALAFLCLPGAYWPPLFAAAPPLAIFVGLPAVYAGLSALGGQFDPASEGGRWRKRALTALLTYLQPVVRLWGRVERGLTPWRIRGNGRLIFPVPRVYRLWFESWQPSERHIASLCEALRTAKVVARRGGSFDRCDVLVRGGVLGGASCLVGMEEHADGKQLVRYRATPIFRRYGLYGGLSFVSLGLVALANDSVAAFAILASMAVTILLRAAFEAGKALAVLDDALKKDEHLLNDSPSTGRDA